MRPRFTIPLLIGTTVDVSVLGARLGYTGVKGSGPNGPEKLPQASDQSALDAVQLDGLAL